MTPCSSSRVAFHRRPPSPCFSSALRQQAVRRKHLLVAAPSNHTTKQPSPNFAAFSLCAPIMDSVVIDLIKTSKRARDSTHNHFFWLVGLFCFRNVRYFDRHASNLCCRIYLVRALGCAGARGSRRCRTCWLRPHARISRCGSHRSAELSPPWIAREEANDISERDDDDDQARLGYEDDHGDGRRDRGKNGGAWQEVADSDAQNRRGQELGGGRHGPHSEAIHVWSHKHTHKHEANTHTGKAQNSASAAQVTTRCGTRPAASCAALLCHATIARDSPPLCQPID